MRILVENLGKWTLGYELQQKQTKWGFSGVDADTRAHELARAEYYDSPTRRYKVEHRKIGKYAEFRAIPSEEKTNEQLRLESIKWFDNLISKQ